MAYPFRGNTATLAVSDQKNLPVLISSFTLVNKTAGTITANVYLIKGASLYCIAPLNNSLSAGAMYQADNSVVVLATEQIEVQVSGSTDYNFTIENIK